MASPKGGSNIPVFRVSAGTAFKAGFFGAVGFLVAQVIAGAIVALFMICVMGISLFGLGDRSGSKPAHPPTAAATEKTPLHRWATGQP